MGRTRSGRQPQRGDPTRLALPRESALPSGPGEAGREGDRSDVAAIVLAAGRGARFGASPKLLAELQGKALVRHVAESAVSGGTRPVIVVVGNRMTDVAAALDGLPVTIVENPDFADGLSTSLKAGVAALPPGIDGALVLLGDMPRIGAELIAGLARAWREAGRPPALVPTHRGKRGNPVLLGRDILALVGTLDGDVGAGPLLKRHPGVVEHPVDDPAVLLDVDTPEALRHMSRQAPESDRETP